MGAICIKSKHTQEKFKTITWAEIEEKATFREDAVISSVPGSVRYGIVFHVDQSYQIKGFVLQAGKSYRFMRLNKIGSDREENMTHYYGIMTVTGRYLHNIFDTHLFISETGDEDYMCSYDTI